MIFNDVFKEQLVEVKRSWKTVALQILIVLVSAVIGFLGLMLGGPLFGPIIIIAMFIGASYLVKSMNVEYEYILTNNELDIDKIMNKERRKRCFTVDIKEIDIMARTDNDMYKAQFDRAEKIIDVSSQTDNKETYAILFTKKDKLTKMIFEPNEDIKQAIYRQAPSKVFL